MIPTYEQLACATRIAASEESTGSLFWMSSDKTAPADLCINVNDLWDWACADLEQIEWDHVFLYEQGLKELELLHDKLPRGTDFVQAQFDSYWRACSFFSVAYAAVKRGSEPQNWLDHFKRLIEEEGLRYRKMNEEETEAWEDAKNWWKKALKKE